MVIRARAIIGCCVLLSSPAAGDESPPAPASVLSCALAAAERTAVPAMLAESNLTWKSSQLSAVTGLLAAAGHFDRALELVEAAQEPDRVLAPALAEIAIGALRAGDNALADRVVKRLSAMKAWTVPAAMIEIAEALSAAGRVCDAVALLQALGDPAAKAGALIELARSSPAGAKQAEGWLREAFRAAREILPDVGHHVEIAGMREYLEDHGQRYSVLLELAGAFAERGLIAPAGEVAAAIGDVGGGADAIWQARALLAVAEAPAASKQASELTAQALEVIESASEWTVGDTREKVEILGSVARRFEDLGKQTQARKALALARSTAEKQKRVDEPGIRASIGVETLVLLAGAHLDLGLSEQALAILDEAQALVDAFTIPKRDLSSSSSWDPVSAARHTRVKARVTIAARREQAGRAANADADARLIAEIEKISDHSWRDSAWTAVAVAYLGVERPERALEILRAGKPADPAQLGAWSVVGESLLAADRLDDAVAVAGEITASYAKVELLAGLADRLEGAGREREAERRITEALRAGIDAAVAAGTPAAGTPAAGTPAGSDRLLIALARTAWINQSGFLARPASAEQRQIMARLGCSRLRD